MNSSKSILNSESRSYSLEVMEEVELDVLVIGGGVNGAGIALDAVSRGLLVGLIEQNDFASGTSSKSSKLIHGGLRYLEQRDFKLVREALHERELMVTTQAPHLVKPVSFLYPLEERFREKTYVGAGLALYDVLRGFKRALPSYKHISGEELREIAPSLRPDKVNSAYEYFDAQVDDARHTMSIARTAAAFGAFIATRTRLVSLLRDGKKVVGARVEDLLTGHTFDVHSKTVVLAAGVWSDELHEALGITPGYQVRMSKGVHLIFPREAINSTTGIIIKTAVSVLFIIPWGDQWLVGTTDTEYTEKDKNAVADESDVSYILDQANRVLNPPLKRDDVIGVFAGLRPLVSTNSRSATTKLSREHIVDHPVPGFVSIAGGKYTTYRVMAQDAVDMAVRDIRKIVPASTTSELPILGAYGYAALNNRRELLSMEMDIERSIIDHLMDRYGSLIEDLLEMIDENPHLGMRVVPELNYIWAEISYAVTHEGAMNLDDILSRRTRLAFELPDAAQSIVSEIADHVAPLLGWSSPEKNAAVKEYLAIASRELGKVHL